MFITLPPATVVVPAPDTAPLFVIFPLNIRLLLFVIVPEFKPPRNVRVPAFSTAFLFSPPVRVRLPEFSIAFAIVRLPAFVVRSAPEAIDKSFSITFALSEFVTVPVIFKAPPPTILFLFVPPVNVNVPAFVIRFAILSLSAFVEKVTPSAILKLFCVIVALSPRVSVPPLRFVVPEAVSASLIALLIVMSPFRFKVPTL